MDRTGYLTFPQPAERSNVRTFDRWSRDCYLDLVCGHGYEEQVPEANHAKWYDLLWLLVPAMGILIFSEVIKERYRRASQ